MKVINIILKKIKICPLRARRLIKNMQDIMTFLRTAKNLQEVIDSIVQDLTIDYNNSKDLKIKEKISAINYYDKAIHNKALIASHRKIFNLLYAKLDKDIPEMLFTLDGNKKAFKSFIEKVDLLQSKNKSIDSAYKDIHRFRLVMNNSNIDTKENVDMLYQATIIIIEFFLENDYVLCQPTALNNTKSFKADEHPNVYVPEKSGLPQNYALRTKDYVKEPKESGYQSIHLLFSDKNGNLFEVQTRTFSMHVCSEYGEKAAHNIFKSNRKSYNWDLSQIHLAGFKYVEIEQLQKDGSKKIICELLDNAGLINPIPTFLRRKTF